MRTCSSGSPGWSCFFSLPDCCNSGVYRGGRVQLLFFPVLLPFWGKAANQKHSPNESERKHVLRFTAPLTCCRVFLILQG